MSIQLVSSPLTTAYGLNPSWAADLSVVQSLAGINVPRLFTCNVGWGTLNSTSDCQGFANYSFPAVKGVNFPTFQISYSVGSLGSPSLSVVDAQGGAEFREAFPNPQPTTLLEYSVFFPADFPFQLGGKLPGLFGGVNYGASCAGGLQSDGSCWSLRLMWRANGQGEVYAYLPDISGMCNSPNKCDATYGISMGRGLFSFVAGQWNNVGLLVQLNSPPGNKNGRIDFWLNGKRVLIQQNVMFTRADQPTPILTSHLMFSTFFGGSSAGFACPKDTYALFANFSMANSGNYSTAPVYSSSTSSLEPQTFSTTFYGLLTMLFLISFYS